jgi:hypothetical protein
MASGEAYEEVEGEDFSLLDACSRTIRTLGDGPLSDVYPTEHEIWNEHWSRNLYMRTKNRIRTSERV